MRLELLKSECRSGQRRGRAAVLRRGIPGSGSVRAGARAPPGPACVQRAGGPAEPAETTLDQAVRTKRLDVSTGPRCSATLSSRSKWIRRLGIDDSRESRVRALLAIQPHSARRSAALRRVSTHPDAGPTPEGPARNPSPRDPPSPLGFVAGSGRRTVTDGMACPAFSNRSAWSKAGVPDRWMARLPRAAGSGLGRTQLSGRSPADQESDGGWETMFCRGP